MTPDAAAPGKLFLSRIRLRQDAATAALARLLMPSDLPGAASGHHLVWSLFADGGDRKRDFLWREESMGCYMVLSARAPVDVGLFDVETKPFQPALVPGDRLAFTLRANATISRKDTAGGRGKRYDVALDALHHSKDRTAPRQDTMVQAGRDWLARQGARRGFTPEAEIDVDGFQWPKIPRRTGSPALIGVMDLSGVLRVDDPALFLPALAAGFGSARAFGCGLMLIRRAAPMP